MTSESDTGTHTADAPLAQHVAAVLAGIGSIGRACDALRQAGWQSAIAGNRITIHDRVFARYIDDGGHSGPDNARWLVYGIDDRSPVWLVGAGAEPPPPGTQEPARGTS